MWLFLNSKAIILRNARLNKCVKNEYLQRASTAPMFSAATRRLTR